MRAWVGAAALGLGLLAPVSARAGAVTVTADEEATLRGGEVVIRELPTGSDGAVRVLAVVDIHASADAVWAALLDFPARKAANAAVQSVEPYKPTTPTELHYRWHISKFGVDIVYHNRYVVDRARGRMVHDLDSSQTNDLLASRGVYELAPSPVNAAWTRLAWDVSSNFGKAIPSFVQRWMSSSATRDFMVDMARRAEERR